jgi:flagellar biosynthesis protein FlhA
MADAALKGAPTALAMRLLLVRGIGAPFLLLGVLAMVVLPLPAVALDVLFTFNIALSVLVVMAVVSVARPLDFAIFPTVLLLATLLRLALNVASTRVVLLHGHQGTGAAGQVIEAFGEFVVGGNYAVGIAVFSILTIINFVVVTKGAGRISEVSARFTLDAMPGKQMAIDADLNAGLVTQDEARARRVEVRTEADFYGSMDGASKFVRGDATAGILILLVNIIGGLAIGTMSHGMAFGQPRGLAVAASLLGVMGLIPGMPNVAFLLSAAALGGGAWMIKRRARTAAAPEPATSAPTTTGTEQKELSWDDVQPVDQIGLEVGFRLVPLVDKNAGGELLARIRGVRRKLTQDLGFLVQTVHVRDNLQLAPNAYRILLAGVPVGEGVIYPERDLAINPGHVHGKLQGIETRDPAFGMEAVWIETSWREQAQTLGYTVVDASTVIATHVSHVIQTHAHELLGHEEVQQLLNGLAKTAPRLVEELVPKTLSLASVVRVLQGLLAERVPIRNLRLIIETLAEHASQTQDPAVLQAQVRIGLGRQIVQDIIGNNGEVPVITLEPELEQLLQSSLNGQSAAALEPGLAERLQGRLADSAQRQEAVGEPAVLMVAPTLRQTLSRFTRASIPGLHVLAWNEIPDNRRIRLVAAVGR